MKSLHYLRNAALGLLLAGTPMISLTSCGSGQGSSATDSMHAADQDGVATDTSSMGRDTTPGAEIPAGAINAGEDSARYGTGTQDTSKNRTGQK
ncbi:hypothetical protein GA0116948_12415 [Chitinophaga costaii]|uniref:Uncharacterized protein n=1 Tax=Chitinophaga costaii TaxID=1335309 RepID=A0A1C4G5S6_9BACT|nr:hypothetical protein [Chitinophaga costaii]SCC63577.1 hypothetical protein GA0116948_12415 [Chitinophaga costaii]